MNVRAEDFEGYMTDAEYAAGATVGSLFAAALKKTRELEQQRERERREAARPERG